MHILMQKINLRIILNFMSNKKTKKIKDCYLGLEIFCSATLIISL